MNNTATEITTMGTLRAFFKDACSGTMMSILDRAFGHPMAAEERASSPLGGGIVQQGYQCGQLWGSSLAAGAQAYRLYGAGPRAEAAAMRASQRLVEVFRAKQGELNCMELTELDMKKKTCVVRYLVTGGPISCARRAVRYAPAAFEAINGVFSEEPSEAPSGCASCASVLARKMGASEQHVVMAAGLAGGIGFSGGACGALGAAVWITGIQHPEEKIGFTAKGTKVGEVMEAFLQSTDHQFECAEIVGRHFESIDDHARYLRDGGCASLLEALAEPGRALEISTRAA